MNTSKSALFERYNAGRQMVREGALDAGRLNRGLGLAQRKEAPSKYHTTATSCDCADQTFRPWVVCKHRLAFVLREATYEGL